MSILESLFGATGVLAFTLIGLGVTSYLLFTAFNGIYRNFVRPIKNLKQYGQWAIVTGASDGIGEAFAHELAHQGFHIVLMARSAEKLKKVEDDIQRIHKVQTKVVTIDFSDTNRLLYQRIVVPAIADIDVGILVNNVGVSYDHPMFLSEVSEEAIDLLVQLNVRTATSMTRLVLPSFEKKKKGAIINVSSVAGVAPSPLLAVYSGTKAYLDFFSRALASEYRSKGIFVQSLTPSLVVSKLSKVRKPSLTIPSAAAFVKSAVKSIGYEEQTSGYWAHDAQSWAMRTLPASAVGAYLLNMHLAIRKRALSKKAQ